METINHEKQYWNKIECECNDFAERLLVPLDKLYCTTEDGIEKNAILFGVRKDVIIRRLKMINNGENL